MATESSTPDPQFVPAELPIATLSSPALALQAISPITTFLSEPAAIPFAAS